MPRYDPAMQVKQYVAKARSRFCTWRVFETGNAKFYLFSQVDPHDCDTGLQVPVRKRDLKPDVRRALAHGCGNV